MGRLISAVDVGTTATGVLTSKYDRPPTRFDDTSKGYTTSSIWQYKGQLWSPVSVAANAAVWVRQLAKQARIVDLLGTSAKFAGGTVALKAGYTGSAIDISVTVSSSAVTATISILATGELDVPALMAVAGKADAGTSITVTKLYDQTGSGNHLTQFGVTGMPFLVYDDVLGRWAIASQSDSSYHGLGNATGPTVTGNNCAMFALGRPIGSADNGNLVIGTFGQYTGGGSHILEFQSFSSGGLQRWSTEQGDKFTSQPYPVMESGPSIVGMISGASSVELFANEDRSTTTAATTQSYTGCLFGTDNINTARYMALRTLGWVLADAAPSAAIATAIRQSAYTLLNIAPQTRDTVVWVGDSRFAGYQASYSESIPLLARAVATRQYRSLNFGCGSKTALSMITTTGVQAARYYRSGVKNIAVVLAGVNDYIVNAASAATAQGYLQTLCQNLKTAGFTVLLVAELDASNAGQHAFLVALRALIVAAGASGMNADEIIDVSDMAPVVAPSDTNNYPDGLHPTAGLSGLIGGRIQERIDYYLTAA